VATATAWVDDLQIASSDDVILLEGQAYFPLEAVTVGVLTPSRQKSLCVWKGVASYYTVTVGDQHLAGAAWSYLHPSPLARRIRGRVAFWRGVRVEVVR
jgi:uncharacterized protein (DUF427 family)